MKKIAVLFAAGTALLSLTASAQTPPAAPTPATAQSKVIINDAFQQANTPPDNPQNKEITGVKPDPVNLPGGAWQLASGDGTYEAYLTPPAYTNAACFHNVASTALSLASNGAYTKPTVMTVSADMAFVADAATGTCFLGFYSALAGGHTNNPAAHFTGLVLQKNGDLQLVENGAAAGAAISYTGKYDPSKTAKLTYSIDTTKGTISNVTLEGSTSAYTFTTKAFTDAATAFVGIGGQTDGQSLVYFNNFQMLSGVSAPVPPPAKTP